MTEHSQDTTRHDQAQQSDYADQPTYQQQSDQVQESESSQPPSGGYREQDYGGETTYDPEQPE